MASDLKSLAHKDWPYIGTDHEWRGFRDKVQRPLTQDENEQLWRAIYQKQNFGPELK